MSESMKPIGQQFGPLLADLERRTRETLSLTARVRQILPDPEKDHIISVSYREDVLIVVVDSAAWSSRIRYLQQELLERLRTAGETQFTKINVRVGAKTD